MFISGLKIVDAPVVYVGVRDEKDAAGKVVKQWPQFQVSLPRQDGSVDTRMIDGNGVQVGQRVTFDVGIQIGVTKVKNEPYCFFRKLGDAVVVKAAGK